MKTTTITIVGMHCKSCETVIGDELAETPGVQSASVSVTKGNATVTYDEQKIDEKRIKEIIRKQGYKA